MNNGNGYVLIQKALEYHWISSNESYFRAWVFMIFNANYEPSKMLCKSQLVDLDIGEIALSWDGWVKKFGLDWTVSKVRTFFDLLEKDKMISRSNLGVLTKVTITNFKRCQMKSQDEYAENDKMNDEEIADESQPNRNQIATKEVSIKKDLNKINKVSKKPARNLPTFQELKEIYIKTGKEYFNSEKITCNEIKLSECAEEFCEFWIGDEEYPGQWFTNKKYKGVRINPERTAKYSIINYKKDYIANYDIPYKEPEPEKTAEEIAEANKKSEQSKKQIAEMMQKLRDKYKDQNAPQETITDKTTIINFAENFGRV